MLRAIRCLAPALVCTALLPLGARTEIDRVEMVNGVGLIDYMREPEFEIGAWARYRVLGTSEMGMQDDYVVTLLIAGEENFWGEDCFWVESWTESPLFPTRAVATLMSYSIFGDSLAVPRLKLYMRKMISGIDPDTGRPIETATKRPAGSLTGRSAVAEQILWQVDSLGSDTAMVPRGNYRCERIAIRQGIATTADVGDSSHRTEVREDHTIYYSPEVPITSIVREDMETSIIRKSWKIGESDRAHTRVMDRAGGSARLLDFGTGLKPELVPVQHRKKIRRTSGLESKSSSERHGFPRKQSG